jgi:hypothetical protein
LRCDTPPPQKYSPLNLEKTNIVRGIRRWGDEKFGFKHHWKILMELFLIWVALSALCAWFSVKKGRGFWGVFIVSFIFSPLVGLIVLLLLKPNQAQDNAEL